MRVIVIQLGTTHFEQLDINVAPTLTLLEAVRTRNPLSSKKS